MYQHGYFERSEATGVIRIKQASRVAKGPKYHSPFPQMFSACRGVLYSMRFQCAAFPSPFTSLASPVPSPLPMPSNKPANKPIPHDVGSSVPIVPLTRLLPLMRLQTVTPQACRLLLMGSSYLMYI